VLTYEGILAPLALKPPTQDQLIHEESGVLQMAGYLLRKLADEVESESEHHHCRVTLRFSE
jgi:NCS2 family nucleobase:cation symporter-2